MNSIDYLDLLMSNQKEVKDGFKFLNLKTNEQATIEDCYETIKKDLEVLEILKESVYRKEEHNYLLNDTMRGQYFIISFNINDNESIKKIKEWLGDD